MHSCLQNEDGIVTLPLAVFRLPLSVCWVGACADNDPATALEGKLCARAFFSSGDFRLDSVGDWAKDERRKVPPEMNSWWNKACYLFFDRLSFEMVHRMLFHKAPPLTWCLVAMTAPSVRGDARGDFWGIGFSSFVREGTGDEELDAKSSCECCWRKQEIRLQEK